MRTITYLLTLLFVFTIPFENVIITSTGSITRMVGALVFCAFLAVLAVNKQIRRPNAYIIYRLFPFLAMGSCGHVVEPVSRI